MRPHHRGRTGSGPSGAGEDPAGGGLTVERRRVGSASPYESTIGFSRAVRVGNVVAVSGTAPVWPDGTVDPDPAAQAARCLEIALGALAELGGSAADVIRTRMFVVDPGDADAVGRVHGEVLQTVSVQPLGDNPTSSVSLGSAIPVPAPLGMNRSDHTYRIFNHWLRIRARPSRTHPHRSRLDDLSGNGWDGVPRMSTA
jgi:enamine deaminase RidA (YjgF/YER057c/UK114 family)